MGKADRPRSDRPKRRSFTPEYKLAMALPAVPARSLNDYAFDQITRIDEIGVAG